VDCKQVLLVVQCCVKQTLTESNVLVLQVTLCCVCLEGNSENELLFCNAVRSVMWKGSCDLVT
jgi:hypothetical protein